MFTALGERLRSVVVPISPSPRAKRGTCSQTLRLMAEKTARALVRPRGSILPESLGRLIPVAYGGSDRLPLLWPRVRNALAVRPPAPKPAAHLLLALCLGLLLLVLTPLAVLPDLILRENRLEPFVELLVLL